MKKFKTLSFVIFLFLIASMLYVNAAQVQLTQLYPEDYSYRSGQTYRVTSYEGDKIVSQENFIWTTHYPFINPQKINANYNDIISDNVGFKAKIIRNPKDNSGAGGKVSYSLALISSLEAKETITLDKNGNYMTSGELTLIDKYGNPKTVYNLGYTKNTKPQVDAQPPVVWGNTFSKQYRTSYNLKNPRCLDGSQLGCSISVTDSSKTNQQDLSPATFSDNYLSDNQIITTNYMYELHPIEDYACYSDPNLKDYNIASSYAYQGLGSIPTQVNVVDAFGRTLSNMSTTYETNLNSFQDCGQTNKNFNCYTSDQSTAPQECKDNAATSCVRMAPAQAISYGPLGQGYFERGYLNNGTIIKENAISGTVNSLFDTCGNVVQIGVSSYYKHPFEQPYGPNYNSNLDLLNSYNKTVKTDFTGVMVSPTKVTVFGPPNIMTQAEYYSTDQKLISKATNERGIDTLYDYDKIGRITKLAVYPDTLSSPTTTYEYSGIGGIMRIHEIRKIDTGKYTELWHFYDGIGRWIQTQTKENDNLIILNSVEYDVLGRKIKEYRPERVSIPQITFGTYYSSHMVDSTWLSYTYDNLNRIINVTDSADGSTTSTQYSIESGIDSTAVKVTDQMNNIRTFYSDAKGNLIDSIYNLK